MVDEIKKLLYQYQQKYPLHKTDFIIEKMLDDGVITFKAAQEIKSGKSLFFIEDEFCSKNNNSIFTEILGGFYTPLKEAESSKTSFNREIESTEQSQEQGDCWLLSDINALSYTEWGRQSIRDAIRPDEDGNGGVTICFKGSPLKQKEFHFTAQDIERARRSGFYASGDDDMIALELATERTFVQMVEQGFATRNTDDSGKYRSYIKRGIGTETYIQYPISKLLGIDTIPNVDFHAIFVQPNGKKMVNNLFKWCINNKDKIAINLGFDFFTPAIGVRTEHAYAIKEIIYGEKIIFSDPYGSDFLEELAWDDFIENVGGVNFSFKDEKTKKQFEKQLPVNYEKYKKEYEEKTADRIKEWWAIDG